MIGLARLVTGAGGGHGPSLNFNFVDGSAFSPQITFTRASTATYFDATGTLQSAAIDVPRFDYDPDTLAARGFLIEEARTNLLRYSNDFTNPVWTSLINGSGTTPTVTAAYTTSPDGTANATRLQASIGAGTLSTDYAFIRQNITGLANPHDVSVTLWMKSNTGVTQNVYFRNNSGTGSTVTASVTTSWQRFTFTLLGVSLTSDDLQVGVRGGLSDATIDISIYGGQLETAAFPTSYIPTTTTTLTRSADVASVNTLSPWYNASEGTLFAEIFLRQTGDPNSQMMASFNDTTANNRWGFSVLANTNATQALRNTGGAGLIITNTSNTATVGAVNKSALAISTGASLVLNGGTVATNASYAAPTVTRLELGQQLGAVRLNGYLRRITYYPRRLSNAELVSITA